MSPKGTLYLIPCTLGSSDTTLVLPISVAQKVKELIFFVVENEKSARYFIKSLNIGKDLNALNLMLLNEHTPKEDLQNLLKPLLEGKDVGIISEAGCPAVADPGSDLVQLAQEKNIRVIPLVGPSSIILALMASGFNGQSFAFNGYLPKDKSERYKKLKFFEKQIYQQHQTQIFIEAPYRNQQLLEELLKSLQETTLLCLATDITLNSETIITKSVADWRKGIPQINKRNTVFLLYKSSVKGKENIFLYT